MNGSPSALPDFCDRYLKKSDREITDLVGEENIISFDHSGNGGRTPATPIPILL